MNRSASAVWKGDIKNGMGSLSTESSVLNDTPYSFSTRFENAKGTNPEELIGAAHAGCFAMALSAALSRAGFAPEQLEVQAQVSVDQEQGQWRISAVALSLQAKVPGVDSEQFEAMANEAKTNCPVSRVLNTSISLQATLLD